MTKAKVVEIPSKRTDLEIKDFGVIVHDKREFWPMALYSAKQFRETGNAVYAIESFGRARLAGRVPPKAILAWIGECFSKWHEAQGKESLDKIMGLAGKKGTTPAYKKALISDRDTVLYYDMARLILIGATIEQAAEMVHAKLEKSTDWNKSKWRLHAPTWESIVQGYKRWPERQRIVEFYRKHFPEWTIESQAEYLKSFPKDSLAPLFRATLYPGSRVY